MKAMLADGIHSDCILSCGVEKFPAHKCVLSARSEVFKQLLAGIPSTSRLDLDPKLQKPGTVKPGQQSSSSGLIEFDDVDPQIMPFLMNYLYTGEAEITDRNVQNVMKCADKFDLPGLRAGCLLFMENRINRGTVIPILIEAYELSNERLKNKCMKYIQDENIDLMNSSQWNTFKVENPKLALSLYERYVKENKNDHSSNHNDLTPSPHQTAHNAQTNKSELQKLHNLQNGFLPKISEKNELRGPYLINNPNGPISHR